MLLGIKHGIQCQFEAYCFDPVDYILKQKFMFFFTCHVNQHYDADDTTYRNSNFLLFCQRKYHKNCSQKLNAYIKMAKIFSTALTGPIRRNFKFCFLKIAHRTTYAE